MNQEIRKSGKIEQEGPILIIRDFLFFRFFTFRIL